MRELSAPIFVQLAFEIRALPFQIRHFPERTLDIGVQGTAHFGQEAHVSSHTDIARANEYIAEANKHVEKQRRLITRTRNPQAAARAQDLLHLLTALLANVQKNREMLKGGHSATRPRV